MLPHKSTRLMCLLTDMVLHLSTDESVQTFERMLQYYKKPQKISEVMPTELQYESIWPSNSPRQSKHFPVIQREHFENLSAKISHSSPVRSILSLPPHNKSQYRV